MQPFELTILGCSSATPTSSRNPTAQLLNHRERFFLIDCGEATQTQLRKFKIKIQRIDHIFISHLHGDHYLGLPGLIGTMHLLGRTKELHIYAPTGLQEIIKVNNYHSKTHLKYTIHFHVLEGNTSATVFDDEKLTVETIVMNHRIPCYGFLFKEKESYRNINKEKIAEYKIPLLELPLIKAGMDFIDQDGNKILNTELTLPPHPPRVYAYCSDTIYNESYINQIKHANLLYHESTFAADMIERAKETYHCTASEAATIALKGHVHQLVIGHYSARYHDLDVLLNEAKHIFTNTVLAIEGKTFSIV
jgi:ribonuclease Z